MSDYDRGPYTPPADRLAFDPREPVRSGGPAPVTLIASALVLLGLVGGVAYLYRHGVRHPGAGPAVVGTTLGPVKTPATAQPGTNQVAGLVIDKGEPAGAAPTFAPPPEQPAPRPSGATASAQPSAQPTPAAIEGPPPPPPPPTVGRPAAKPVATVTIASLTDAALTEKPAAKLKPTPAVTAPNPTATIAPAATAGANWVQIGAFSSAALADKGWSDVARLAPVAIKGKSRKVEPIAKDGATLYRTYVTGFASHAAAEAFCGDLKAAGHSCIVK